MNCIKTKILKERLKKYRFAFEIYSVLKTNKVVMKIKSEVTYQKLKHNNLHLTKGYSKERIILFFGVPHHSNAGDQAQTMSTIKWLNRYYPDSIILQVNSTDYNSTFHKYSIFLRELITEKNLVFIQSGYNTTDIYLEEEMMHRRVLQEFPNNQVVVLPQTVNFRSEVESQISRKIYNNHQHLIFFARDDISFEKAKALFNEIPVYLYPDIVTTLIGTQEYSHQRKGVLFCMRNDVESYFDPANILELRKTLAEYTFTDLTDTTLDISYKTFVKEREKILHNIFDQYSKYEVIVTDRYHGIIFSLISGTPVVVLNSADHKLSSGVKWFSSEYKDYIYHANSLREAKEYVLMLLHKKLDRKLSDYFNKEYYDKLKKIIEEKK